MSISKQTYKTIFSGHSLICNFCIGGESSDCARNITRSMATIKCRLPGPHPHPHKNLYRQEKYKSVAVGHSFIYDKVSEGSDVKEYYTDDREMLCVYIVVKGIFYK